MSKELSPEHKNLIEGLIRKHSKPDPGLPSYYEKNVTDWKAAMEELVTILSPDRKKFTLEECKWLLFYGEPERNSPADVGKDDGRIDVAILLAFDLLGDHTHMFRDKVVEIFWKRIQAIANLTPPKQ